MLLAGFTDAFVIGMLTKCIKVSDNPIINPDKFEFLVFNVTLKNINTKKNVIINSVIKHAITPNPNGECFPKPFEAKLPISINSLSVTIKYNIPAPKVAPNN